MLGLLTARDWVAGRRIVRVVRIVPLLDELPSAVVRRPGRVWNVFARSLGEQGADGRTSLAWRWTLAGACPSPITLSASPARPPGREELLAEARAPAELGSLGGDAGGQVMHARFVLQWLVGELDALPLWNGGPSDPHMTDGADFSRSRNEIEEAYDWAHLARTRFPWPGESSLAAGAGCGGIQQFPLTASRWRLWGGGRGCGRCEVGADAAVALQRAGCASSADRGEL